MSFRPVDLGAANLTIQAFQHGAALKQQQAEQAQQKELELKRLQQQKELEEERLAQQHELETKQLDLMSAAHELNKLVQTQQLGQKYPEFGITPAGTQVTSPSFSQPRPEEVAPSNIPNYPPQAINAPIPTDLSNIPKGYVELSHP